MDRKMFSLLIFMCFLLSLLSPAIAGAATNTDITEYNLNISTINESTGDPNFKIINPRISLDEFVKSADNTSMQAKVKGSASEAAYVGFGFTGAIAETDLKSSFEFKMALNTLGDSNRAVVLSLRRSAVASTPTNGEEEPIVLSIREKKLGINSRTIGHTWLSKDIAGMDFSGSGAIFKIVDDIVNNHADIYCNNNLIATLEINGATATLCDANDLTNKLIKTYSKAIAKTGTFGVATQACIPTFSAVKVAIYRKAVVKEAMISSVLDDNGNELSIEALQTTQNIKLQISNLEGLSNASFIVAYYGENENLVKVKVSKADIPASSEVVINNDPPPNVSAIRIFMWKGWSDINPVTKAFSITEDTVIKNSITYAQSLKNQVDLRYYSPEREDLVFENKDAVFTNNLKSVDNKQLASLTNKDGGVYLNNTMDMVIESVDGTRYVGKSSDTPARMNAYKLGMYYSDVHILDLIPKKEGTAPGGDVKGALVIDNLSLISKNTAHVGEVKLEDEALTFEITNSIDPYIVISGQSVNLANTEFLKVVMKYDTPPTTNVASGRAYYATSTSSNIEEKKAANFTIMADGEYHTYFVEMISDNWKDSLTALRFDVNGGEAGAKAYIKSIEVASFAATTLPGKLDIIYNMFSDKIHGESHFIATSDVEIKQAYTETAIDKNKVLKIEIKDKSGITDINSYDPSSVEYVGFDILGSGVFGYIYPNILRGKTSITLENDMYIVRNYANKSGLIKKGERSSVYARIFTTKDHSFSELAKQAKVEKSPLTAKDILLINPQAYNLFDGYNPVKGWYQFKTYGIGMTEAFHTRQTETPDVNFSIKNDGLDRQIYIQTYSDAGALTAAAVQTLDKTIIPIPVEVNKNFQGEFEEPFYEPLDIGYSESLFPIKMGKFQKVSLNSSHMYQQWGKYPLKQVSGIRYYSPYYHISTGVTESNCWVPFYINNSGWLMSDLRARSGPMWQTQPQFNSVGIDKIFEYKNEAGELIRGEKVGVKINSAGTSYSDLSFLYKTYDGKVTITERSVEFPQTDENRTFISLDITFNDDLTILNAKKDFAFFYTYANFAKYRKLSYIDQGNNHQTVAIVPGTELSYALGSNYGYWTLHDYPMPLYGTQERLQDGANLGVMVRDLEMSVGGVPSTIGAAVYNKTSSSGVTETMLTLNAERIEFKKGDKIKLNFIILPWGYIDTAADTNMQNLRQTDGINRLSVTADIGSVVYDPFIPIIKLENSKAEFTLKGGLNNVAFRIEGADSFKKLNIERFNGSTWEAFDNSVNGIGGYGAYVDSEGKFGFSYVYVADGGEIKFRVN